jgi:hypothetical protein
MSNYTLAEPGGGGLTELFSENVSTHQSSSPALQSLETPNAMALDGKVDDYPRSRKVNSQADKENIIRLVAYLDSDDELERRPKRIRTGSYHQYVLVPDPFENFEPARSPRPSRSRRLSPQPRSIISSQKLLSSDALHQPPRPTLTSSSPALASSSSSPAFASSSPAFAASSKAFASSSPIVSECGDAPIRGRGRPRKAVKKEAPSKPNRLQDVVKSWIMELFELTTDPKYYAKNVTKEMLELRMIIELAKHGDELTPIRETKLRQAIKKVEGGQQDWEDGIEVDDGYEAEGDYMDEGEY